LGTAAIVDHKGGLCERREGGRDRGGKYDGREELDDDKYLNYWAKRALL
jgi:hypothetical protein